MLKDDALTILKGREFQTELVWGTNEYWNEFVCARGWCRKRGWRKRVLVRRGVCSLRFIIPSGK